MSNKYFTLQELKRSKKKRELLSRVYVWSGEWQYYWRPDGKGYTSNKLEAGIYPFEEAWGRVSRLGKEKKIILIDTESRFNPQ